MRKKRKKTKNFVQNWKIFKILLVFLRFYDIIIKPYRVCEGQALWPHSNLRLQGANAWLDGENSFWAIYTMVIFILGGFMEGKIHGIMNVYYENYTGDTGENKGKRYQPYCVNCKSYQKSLELIDRLEGLGFTVVERQTYGYCAVLVNFELKRCSGIRLACRYTTPDKEVDIEDFEQILEEHLKGMQL